MLAVGQAQIGSGGNAQGDAVKLLVGVIIDGHRGDGGNAVLLQGKVHGAKGRRLYPNTRLGGRKHSIHIAAS